MSQTPDQERRAGSPRLPAPATSGCVFCGRDWERGRVARSAEHVWPQWIREHAGDLPPSRLSHRAGFVTSASGMSFSELPTVTTTNKASILNVITREVCQQCNNGWMSRLETSSRPVILAVADAARDGSQIVLDGTHAQILATWAEKTAVTNELTSDRPRVVTTIMGQRLRAGLPLRGSAVWAARNAEDFGLSIVLAHILIGATAQPLPGEQDRHVILTTITYRHLTLLVFIAGDRGELLQPAPLPLALDRWTLVWPTRDEVEFPPSKTVNSGDLVQTMTEHGAWLPMSNVSVIHRSPFPAQVIHRN